VAGAVGGVAVDRSGPVVVGAGVLGEVGDEFGDGFDVAGVTGGDLGGGDDLAVRVDGDMGFVAVETAVAGLVSVPGLRVDGRDHPIGGDFPGDPQQPGVAGMKVLT
jgi:hypothetical protein